MTTIGGVAFRHLDRLPVVGDNISIEDISITVLEMDGHRVARVRVSRGVRDDEVVVAGESANAEETPAEVQAQAGSEQPDGNMPVPDGDENIAAASQSSGTDRNPGSSGTAM
jgi:hypothetical protein